MTNVRYIKLNESHEKKCVSFLLENDHYLLERCRNDLHVPADEAVNYLKHGLHIAFNSIGNCSSAAIDERDGNIVGINSGYLTTLSDLLERYKNAANNTSLWPSMIPLFAMQVKLLEKAMPELLKHYSTCNIIFADFTLLNPDLWSLGIAAEMGQESIKLAFGEHGKLRPDAYLGISNSSLGRKDGGTYDVTEIKYVDFLVDGRSPFPSLAGERMVLTGAKNLWHAVTSKL